LVAADDNAHLQVARVLVHQQQSPGLGLQDLHGVLGDQAQQPVHVAHLRGKLVGDLVDGSKLAGALLHLVEKLELVNGARRQVRNVHKEVLLLVAEGDARLGQRRDHHAEHAAARIRQQRDAQPRLEPGIVRRSVGGAAQGLARVVVGA